LRIFSSLIIHEFQKLENSLSLCTSLLTDTKNQKKKVKKKNRNSSLFPRNHLKKNRLPQVPRPLKIAVFSI